jgi:GT2 family glycosyltransferase
MHHLPRLTVAIATRDRPDKLARALAALAGGELIPDRVIVVDQSRQSDTRHVVDAAPLGLPLLYVHSRQVGAARSRNIAISWATSPYVAFTDDDCVPDPGWAKALAEAFTPVDAPDALTGPVLPLGPEEPGLFAVSSRTGARAASFADRARPWEMGTGGNLAAGVPWLRRIGGFDERLGPGTALRAAEDVDLLYRLLFAGARLRYEPAAVIYHERQTAESRMASRYGYGVGLGAFLSFRLRARDSCAPRLVRDWVAMRSWAAAGNLRRAQWTQFREEMLFLRGTAVGFFRGLTLARVHGECAH